MFRENLTRLMKILFAREIEHSDRLMGITKINSYLEKLEIPVKICSIPGKRKGEESIWKVTKNSQ